MEIIPFLIFGFIAFQIFKGFTRASGNGTTESAKTMMRNLHAQIEKTNSPQIITRDLMKQTPTPTPTPTQRGRDSLARKEASSPWGENDSAATNAQMGGNYSEQSKAARKAAQKSPEQSGRRGQNVDQNRNRTDGWGQRGDSGFFNGKTIVIFLVIGGAILYALSNFSAA